VGPAEIDTLAVDLAPGDAPPGGALVTVAPVIGVSPVGVSMSSEPEAVMPTAVPATTVAATAAPAMAAAESSPAAGEQAAEAGIRKWSLSPSRAADFMTCPLLYRFRVIDKLPEAPSAAAARGTLVHAVLERLFDVPALARSPEAAAQLIEPEWQRLIAAEPELADVFGDEAETKTWLTQARAMLDRYFTLEDPTRLEPAHRELQVQAVLSSGLRLRGYIDRLDISPAGDVRIVDYKTGTAPRAEFEARALFQMKFYALALWRSMGTVPRLLQLMYLGNGEIVRYSPDEADLLATERKIDALWRAIEKARDAADWRPRRGRLCAWCSHQQFCPEFGGTPPPLPASGAVGQSPALEAAKIAGPPSAELSHIVDLVDL
jgi:putative RecB family exonuclease